LFGTGDPETTFTKLEPQVLTGQPAGEVVAVTSAMAAFAEP